ncbi:MAG: hypothetical protein KatS3mg104_0274 [Phycisphaerae bacterium]|jgi:hypothetical protein|nr:MAG: hypothetical protein KatS3mg104_0274 [Phycisphaerae bacterium]
MPVPTESELLSIAVNRRPEIQQRQWQLAAPGLDLWNTRVAYTVRASGRIENEAEIASIVIGGRNGTPITYAMLPQQAWDQSFVRARPVKAEKRSLLALY